VTATDATVTVTVTVTVTAPDGTAVPRYPEHKVKHTLLLEGKKNLLVLKNKLVPTLTEEQEFLFDTILMSVFQTSTIPQNGQ
jgi:hypothetical protein